MKFRQFLAVMAAFSILSGSVTAQAAEPKDIEDLVQTSVDKGLAYLASQQQASGAWQFNRQDSTAGTSLAVLSFLANGHVPGKGAHGAKLQKAIDFVLGQQKPNAQAGIFSDRVRSHGPMYTNGIATWMLAEALGKLDKKRAARCRVALVNAVTLIARAQDVQKAQRHEGGWRYQPSSRDSDLSVTVWQLKALYAAQKGLGDCATLGDLA